MFFLQELHQGPIEDILDQPPESLRAIAASISAAVTSKWNSGS